MKTLIHLLLPFCILLASAGNHALAQPHGVKLIVVQDGHGTSALPYYEKSGLTAEEQSSARPWALGQPFAQVQSVDQAQPANSEASMLPVVSHITPGNVISRMIHAPGLTPFFIIGDDDLSRQWLRQRYSDLQALNAFGLVVNVPTMDALQSLRQLAPELVLSPVPGDDLAHRLQLNHYPALITATGIEQ